MWPALALSSSLIVGLAADAGPPLSAVAASSGRPPECTGSSKRATAGPSVWQRARLPQLEAYCSRVADARRLLESDPAAAAARATEAETLWPGHAAPQVVLGRAALARGKAADAVTAFAEALARDPASVTEALARVDHAHALVMVGRHDDARRVYRDLVTRASLLPAPLRPLVLLRAAHASMAAAATGDTASALAEAEAYLDEARRDAVTPWAGDALASLALVAQRTGDARRAGALSREVAERGARLGAVDRYLARPEDRHALAAITAPDGAASRAAWQAYLAASPPEPWAAAARAAAAPTERKPAIRKPPRSVPRP